MEVIKDLKKVTNQVLGKENMFGFKTTLANQMYLIFCIIGNVYYTDKIHWKTKLVWMCGVNAVFVFVGVSIVLCLMYGKPSEDIILLIYMAFMIIFVVMEQMVKPAIAVIWHRNEIERMISMADELLMENPITEDSLKNYLDAKKMIKYTIFALVISISMYATVASVDVVLFYEEEKVKNYMYYIAPLPGLDQSGSLTFYVLYAAISSACTICGFMVFIAHRVFAIPWVIISHNEAQRIINEFNSLSEDVDINIDTFKSIKPKFTYVMRECIHDIENIKRFITNFRGFFEASASFILPLLLFTQVVHALMIVSSGTNTPFVIRLREFSLLVASLQEVYVMCWVGATLEQITSDLSFAVYSTPWYWLKSIRKDVYILLCQTQAEINPRALRVYPLTLTTFLRFCNVINSTVNVFRAYTQKKLRMNSAQ